MGAVVTGPLSIFTQWTWTAPADNGAEITAYRLLVEGADGTMKEEQLYCPPTDTSLLTNRYCNIPMAVLRAPPYSLTYGTLIRVQVQARNLKGWSVASPLNTAGSVLETEPVAPATPTRIHALTDDFQMAVDWTELVTDAERGGPSAPITSYRLEWDGTTNGATWTVLVGVSPLSLATNFTATVNVIPGGLYQFRVAAKNKYGWGPYSGYLSSYAATEPEAPDAPTTTRNDTNITIAWTTPDENGLPVTRYEVEILQDDGTWASTPACDGSDPTVVAENACHVPMVTLRLADFALALNDEVKARLRATNLIGTGPFSTATVTGATISTEPLKPPTPPYEGSNTDDTQLHIVWNALTGDDTGGEPITVYQVWWDLGLGSWVPYIIQSSSFTYTYTQTSGVAAGQSYQFKYRASNKHGTGVYSNIASIVASTVPDQLAAATTANSGADVIATWGLTPSDRGATVTAYRIVWKAADGTYATLTACNGADATVFTNRECTVPMSALTDASTFNLALGANIFAAVEAINAKGASTPSADGGGALAQTPPIAGPTAARGGDTSSSQIEVTWAALDPSLNGGAAVTAFELFGDLGSGGALGLLAEAGVDVTRVFHNTNI